MSPGLLRPGPARREDRRVGRLRPRRDRRGRAARTRLGAIIAATPQLSGLSLVFFTLVAYLALVPLGLAVALVYVANIADLAAV